MSTKARSISETFLQFYDLAPIQVNIPILMLTRLTISGFKNLLDVDMYFGPFTCIAGPNAAGKSNLFDAIRFLALLTQHPILEAVKQLREAKGRSPQPSTLFSSFTESPKREMTFRAEMIVDRNVDDDFGEQAKAAISSYL